MKIDCIDLIEKERRGIISILFEECKMPKATDQTFLQKITAEQSRNPHFGFHLSFFRNNFIEVDQKIADTFNINHFAGAVTYDVNGFLEVITIY